MTPRAVLIELLDRLGSTNGKAVFVSTEELSRWPPEAVTALKVQQLVTKTRSAASVVCTGCEQECIMPVHTASKDDGVSLSFVQCDKRDDMSRVRISSERLEQWRCGPDALRRFIAASLGMSLSSGDTANAGLLAIGTASGKKHRQMLGLKCEGRISVVAGYNEAPLTELVEYQAGVYSLDVSRVRELVDSGATANPRYTPSQAKQEVRKSATLRLYKRWQKAYRDLKKQRPGQSDVWYSKKIAKMPIAVDRTAETIRKHMK